MRLGIWHDGCRRQRPVPVSRGWHHTVQLMTRWRPTRRSVAVLPGTVTELSLTLGPTHVVVSLLGANWRIVAAAIEAYPSASSVVTFRAVVAAVLVRPRVASAGATACWTVALVERSARVTWLRKGGGGKSYHLIDRFEGIAFVPAVRTVKQIVLGESSVVVVVAVVVQVVGTTEPGGSWRN